MKKYLVLVFALMMAGWQVKAQQPAESKSDSPVKWITFEEAVEKSKTEKRKIFIDVYTDWCGWCKVMDKNTFTDPQIAKTVKRKVLCCKI